MLVQVQLHGTMDIVFVCEFAWQPENACTRESDMMRNVDIRLEEGQWQCACQLVYF